MNTIVNKPWGFYKIIESDDKYLIKEITVNPKGKLSLQSHQFRSEHWVIVSGTAEVEIDSKKYLLNADKSIYIPKKAKHRLTNTGEDDLILVEVWFGDNLKEEDIVRYEDIYDRI